MKRGFSILGAISLVITLVVGALLWQTRASASGAGVDEPVFMAMDVYIDSGEVELAAYQIEYVGGAGVLLVGIEGGEHLAFSAPPAYDPAALRQDRVILAAFNTGDNLPTGRTRIARLHLMITDDARPGRVVAVQTAVDASGRKIDVIATVSTIEPIPSEPREGNE